MTKCEAVAAVVAAEMLLYDEAPDEPVAEGEEDNDVLDAIEGLSKLKLHIEQGGAFAE